MEAFDDPELELHSPQHWLALGAASDAGVLTGATPYYLTDTQAYTWEACEVKTAACPPEWFALRCSRQQAVSPSLFAWSTSAPHLPPPDRSPLPHGR